ncbi:MAG: universal stress protein [Chitinophagaceae bacterium]|nr:universal stress protein [Chitinophagaceae bacterium]
MKTVIVPVDFSATSLNAATYAVKMFTGIYGINMTLYHMYDKPENGAACEKDMAKLKEKLFEEGIVKMEILCEQGNDLVGNMERLAKENPVDMIIIGITGKNKVAQTLVGSNTVKLAGKNICPVLIVPPDARFTQIKNIALTSDFSHAPSPLAVTIMKDITSAYFAKLHIVNVNPEHNVTITEPYQQVKDKMDDSFKGVQHEFYFLSLYDFQDTMNMFVHDHHIDMLIILPKERNWLNHLTGDSNTKKMAYHSTVPVLTMH